MTQRTSIFIRGCILSAILGTNSVPATEPVPEYKRNLPRDITPVPDPDTGANLESRGFMQSQLSKSDSASTDAAAVNARPEQNEADDDKFDFATVSGAYKQSLIDNDFSYLDDPNYDDWHFGESLKRLSGPQDFVLDVGGDYRVRFHDEDNLRGKPLSGQNDSFVLHRTRVYADAQFGPDVRVFAQALDAVSFGEDLPSRSSEENRSDAANLFVELRLLADQQTDWSVRGGRQEILLGSQRLLTNSPWRNTTVAHDGVRTWVKRNDWRTDAFWVRPIDVAQHLPTDSNFDNPDQSQELFGVFTRWDAAENHELDAYWIALQESDKRFVSSRGTAGQLNAHSLGLRWYHTGDQFQAELETVLQVGDAADEQIRAGFVTGGVGRLWNWGTWKHSLWGYYDWASGDDSQTDDTHGTAVRYFPRGHYYLGYADVVGRQNMHDLNVHWRISPGPRLQIVLAAHMFDLSSATDALYNTGGRAIYRDPTGTSGRDVGEEIDILVRWKATPRNQFGFGYSRFFVGDYFGSPNIRGGVAGIDNNATGKDANFLYVTYLLRF